MNYEGKHKKQQAVLECNFDLLPGEHKVRPYDRPERGTVAMGQAKVGANLVFARLSMKFSILGQPGKT
jgi:hypothetical protein